MIAEQLAGFARDVAGLAEEALWRGRRDEEAFVRLMADVEEQAQAALTALRPAGEAAPACARGCASCCTVNVGTLAIEGAAAAAYLRHRRRPDERARLAAELLRFHGWVRWQEDGERIRARARCPLLDERGGCSIHPVRPLACRALSSLSAAECRVALEARRDGDDPGLVRMNLLQNALYGQAFGAVAGVLRRRGLDGRRRDVSGMTGWFLADARRAAAWSSGEAVALE